MSSVIINEFEGRRYASFSYLLNAVESYQKRFQLQPLIDSLSTSITEYRLRFLQLQSNFLSKPPVSIPADNSGVFTIQSTRKDVRAAARRYALGGQQARGLHVSLRDVATKFDHFELAKQAKHPSLLLSGILIDFD